MKRIAVIGNAGGGKSTLARKLAAALGLPYHEVDALQWRPDWTPVPAADVRRAHEAILKKSRWLLDGFGDWESVERRFTRADTIILVDLPLWVHYWLAAERQIAWASGGTGQEPAGHGAPPPTRELFEMMWRLDRDGLPRLRRLAKDAEAAGKGVVRLRSLEELDRYAASLGGR